MVFIVYSRFVPYRNEMLRCFLFSFKIAENSYSIGDVSIDLITCGYPAKNERLLIENQWFADFDRLIPGLFPRLSGKRKSGGMCSGKTLG